MCRGRGPSRRHSNAAPCLGASPWDAGCESAGDASDEDPPVPPECANQVDDDADGLTDFPYDPGCDFAADSESGDATSRGNCHNGFDDDGDGLTDFPNDPGCDFPGDPDEFDPDPRVFPACANGDDDDGDLLADYPFDPGCVFAADPDESDDVVVECNNGRDDDRDGLADFPRDPGCASSADPDEADPRLLAACANGRDDDGNDRVDFPDDPGCTFAADDSEITLGGRRARCADSVDNDDDGDVDAADLGCVDAEDDDESDPVVPALCGDGRDNDGDGDSDFPFDAGCVARGDPTEDQSCRAEVQTIELARNSTVLGTTGPRDADLYAASCGGRGAPERVYHYALRQAADLTFSVDNPRTNFRAVLSVRNDCEAPESELACASLFDPPGTVTLGAAPPGDYFVIVDGGGASRWVSSGEDIDFPASPDGFEATHADLGPTSWGDGGGDAFDGFGRTQVVFDGIERELDVSAGARAANVNGYSVSVTSDFPAQNVWRLRLDPAVAGDQRRVSVLIGEAVGFNGGGNLGCDRDCVEPAQVIIGGQVVDHIVSVDGSDPDTVMLLLPSDPEQLGQVTYENNNDNVQITATDVVLPVTFYVGLTNGDLAQAADAIVADIDTRGGLADGEAAFGSFELSVVERPVR